MDAINGAFNAVFDIVFGILSFMGRVPALILVSGVFGILALLAFKYISWQGGIKGAKDKIKGHMIAIRIYQDDLVEVAKSVGRILVRNLQYIALNFGPFIPLSIPFVFVLAQLVVRFAFAPLPVQEVPQGFLSGQGTMIRVEMAKGHEAEVLDLEIVYPEGVKPMTKLFKHGPDGVAYQEVIATSGGRHELQFKLAGGLTETKLLAAGEEGQGTLQGERVRSALHSVLWPAESRLSAESGLERIAFEYPDSDLGWFPGGIGGVLLLFLAASMLFGFLALKPLGVQI